MQQKYERPSHGPPSGPSLGSSRFPISESEPVRTLLPKDLEVIRRLLRLGNRRAAAKVYAGAMNCGMKQAAAFIRTVEL